MQRRRKKLVRLDLQIRVACIALIVTSIVVFVNFHLSVSAVATKASSVQGSLQAAILVDELWRSIMVRSLVSLALAIPIAMAVAVVYSFNFAGPLYRFKQYFTGLVVGPWDSPCRLRKGDDLQDICQAINGGLDSFRAVLREQQAILASAREILQEQVGEGQNAPERVAELLARVDAVQASFAARFPEPQVSTALPQSESQKQLELQA